MSGPKETGCGRITICSRADGEGGFTLLEMIVAVAILSLFVALIPRSFVAARAALDQSQAWLQARLVAESVLNGDLAGSALQAGRYHGVLNGRRWSAELAPDIRLPSSAPPTQEVLLDLHLNVKVSGDQALEIEGMRIGRLLK